MKRTILKSANTLICLMLFLLAIPASAQNIFSGEPVQVVGSFNGYVTVPYNADYRTCYYRRVSTPSGNPTDGRGQWVTNINVQNSGGNVTPVNMTGGGGNGFLFISGPLSNRFQNKWVFSGIGSGAVDAINNISAYNSGNDMGLNMSTPGQYNFIFNDCGYTGTNAKYYVGYTSSIVVQAFRTSQTIVNGQAVINMTTQGVPSPEQKIYVRYSVGTNDFTSSTSVVQASGSGTSWTATIPPPSCNTTVYYYVYSSTRTLAQIATDSEMDKTLATLLWDDNAGNNYSVVFGSPTTYYQDADSDGFGNVNVTQLSCSGAPTGYVANSADCNDNQLQYLDADGDSYGSTTLVACGVANSLDCDDVSNSINPAATETCNGIDDNCDGNIDEGVAPACQNGATVVNCSCVCPVGYIGILCQIAVDSDSDGVPDISDCSPSNPLIYQSALLYTDVDGDGYHTNAAVVCYGATLPAGTSLTTLGFGDCNDNNPTVYFGATEICYDGIDNDCDGTVDEGCTPIVTVIQGTQCGATLPSISSYIYANIVSGAQAYRFKVTDLTTNQVQTIDRVLRVFTLTQLGNYAFNRTYQVEVAVRYNNVWQPFYGLPCTVTTPATTTQIKATQCGSTLTTMNEVIYADNVPYAMGYKFRVTNLITSAQQEIERPIRDFRMSDTTIAQFNTTYSVEVAVKNTNGNYLPYGTVCNVTTPSFPTTQLQATQCDVTISNLNTTVYADSFSGASSYRFRFTNGAFVYTFDRPVRSFVLSSVPGISSGNTYSVQVALEINGVFGPYGKICTIALPGGSKVATEEVKNLQIIAYPNPYSSSFKLELTTSSDEKVRVQVYDMLGKLVEDAFIEVIGNEELELGTQYPSGVYNVIVSQGSIVRMQRLVKR